MVYEFKQVSKSFGDKEILKDISFNIGPGKIIGLSEETVVEKLQLYSLCLIYCCQTRGKYTLIQKG